MLIRKAGFFLIFCLVWYVEAGAQNQTSQTGNYVRVSPQYPQYLEYEDGTPYIPIGPNICWPRTTADPDETLGLYHEWFSKLAENGGNFTRIWLSAPVWEVEHTQAGEFDTEKAEFLLDSLLAIASTYNIKVKFCFENFRQLLDRPAPFAGSVPFDRPIYHVSKGGTLHTMDEYFNSEAGKDLFRQRMEFFANRYGNHPNVFGWELWNEINSVSTSNKPADILSWTELMLTDAREFFPHQLLMQSMGSFDHDNKRDLYRKFCQLPGNEIAQAHRYLDPGADLPVCQAPMDVLSADATRELLNFDLNKPVILSEVGAVEANHAGPSKLYEADTEGVLLHDLLFAPFFSGAAGPGQSWHWHHYIEKHDLWWHFGRFSHAIKGINPIAEYFSPQYAENEEVRIYTLEGSQTTLIWCRDKTSNWQSELVERKKARSIKRQKISLTILGVETLPKVIRYYLPWEDRWLEGEVQENHLILPTFTRSIVIWIEK